MSESCSVVSDSLQLHGLHCSWDSPGQNTGVGSSSLLQGIFPTQGSNPGLPHCRWILYQLSHQESPRILGWVAYPFSSRSSWPSDGTQVSHIAGGFFYQPSHKGSPRILGWVAYPFSSGSSWPRYPAGVSCIADGFFTNWDMSKAHAYTYIGR